MSSNRGILLLSLGNPYYVRMAYQLAYSIKANEDIPIAIVTNNIQFLTTEQKKVFDIIIDCPKEFIEDKKYIRVKTLLYKLSPFEETMFLDSDMIILNVLKLSHLFEQLKDVDFTVANRGKSDILEAKEKTSDWGNLIEARKHFGIDKGYWYQLSSEFIYFKKTEKVKLVFETALEIFNTYNNYRQFAGFMADEFAIGLSCIINDLYPHAEYFTPIFWQHAEKRFQRVIDPHINEKYYGFSMGGAYANEYQKGFYNNMLKYYQQVRNEKIQVFPAESKARYLEERKTI